MRILIIGAGETGVRLAQSLIADNHRVTLVDGDAERVRTIASRLDCAVVQAKDSDLGALMDAGLASADALVAVTAHDEVNMLVCSLANAVCPSVQKIARVSDPDYYRNFMDLSQRCAGKFEDGGRSLFGIDWMVNPNREMAKQMTRMVMRRRNCGILELEDGYVILSLRLGAASPLAGKTIGRLFEVKGWRYRALCVYDEDETSPAVVTPRTAIAAGKRLDVLARAEDVQDVASLCDAGEVEDVRLLVAGAGPLTPLMVEGAQALDRNWTGVSFIRGSWRARVNMDIAIVDASPERCRRLAERFAGLKVFCGDVTDENLVREERLDGYGQAVSLTEDYDRNLITAAYLKSCGVPLTVALTANADVVDMARRLGVDVAVPIRETVVASVKNHLYGRSVLQVEKMANDAFDLAYCTMTRRGGIPDDAVVLLAKGKDEPEFHAPEVQAEFATGDRLLLMVPSGRLEDVRKAVG